MRRRALLPGRRRLLGLGALSAIAPLPVLGQRRPPRRIAVVHFRGGLMNRGMPHGKAFLEALHELGYREGVDLTLDERLWSTLEEADAVAQALVREKPEVIVAGAPPSIAAVSRATREIPVVMMYTAEPVALGLVASLGRPGGNLTGLAWDHGFETSLKSLELLKEALPRLARVALLWDASDTAHPFYAKYFDQAAPRLGLSLLSLGVRTTADFAPAVRQAREARVQALVFLPSAQLTIPHRHAILALVTQERIPALINIVDARDYPGAFMRYGPNLAAMPRRAAAYVDRILKGAKPADMPIEQPDKYDLWIDLRVARELGVKLPSTLLARADRVIE